MSNPLHRVARDFKWPPAASESTHEHANHDTETNRLVRVGGDGADEDAERCCEPREDSKDRDCREGLVRDANTKEDASDGDKE